MAKKMVTIRLSPSNARLVALNIDGWLDAGACEGGLEDDERAALHSAYDQILRGLGGKLTKIPAEPSPSLSSAGRPR
jgi:hypothetical protein